MWWGVYIIVLKECVHDEMLFPIMSIRIEMNFLLLKNSRDSSVRSSMGEEGFHIFIVIRIKKLFFGIRLKWYHEEAVPGHTVHVLGISV